MKNSKIAVQAKKEIVKEFYRMRRYIQEQMLEKESEEYKKLRAESKIGRVQETDIIKLFVEYAEKQGSKSANMYYMSISKMENQAFFILKEKFKNVREILNIKQLSKIMIADMIVRQALIEGMEQGLHYKKIYILARDRVIALSKSIGVKDVISLNPPTDLLT